MLESQDTLQLEDQRWRLEDHDHVQLAGVHVKTAK